MSDFKPVIFLAFANDAGEQLELLERESRDIYKILEEFEEEGKIFIHKVDGAGLDDIEQHIVKNGERFIIFHYGGHADSQSLRFEDGAGYAGGLAKMLGKLGKLWLVFLNGCATRDQVENLLKAGVKAVIATRVSVGDREAYEFSKAFYESFAKGKTLQEAYEHACDSLMFRHKESLQYQVVKRSIGFDPAPGNSLSNEPKWTLFHRDAASLTWTIPAVEVNKILITDTRLVDAIHAIEGKIKISLLLAGSSAERLPNGSLAPYNVNNEIALIKEFVYKLFIHSSLKDKFEIHLYQLNNRNEVTLAVTSAAKRPAGTLPLPALSDMNLIIWVVWNNLGAEDKAAEPPLSWLYRQVFQLPEQERPLMQIYRRAEAIAFGIDHPNREKELAKHEALNSFFHQLTEERIIDYHPELFEEEFEHNLRNWLRKVIAFHLESRAREEVKAGERLHTFNPYKGLKTYQFSDARVFFGRINEVDLLRAHLVSKDHQGLLAVIGASGSGKSSLVRAGLFSRLDLDAIPGSGEWKIIECRIAGPSEFVITGVVRKEPDLETLKKDLPDLIGAEWEAVNRFVVKVMKDHPEDARFVLFVDQFEEIFTLLDQDKYEEHRRRFIQLLIHIAQCEQGQVILTMRSEYFHRCLEYDLLVSFMEKGQQLVLPPNRESMMRIIARPAMFSGYQFDEGLRETIWEDAARIEGTLPLVSYVLEQLVEKRQGHLLTKRAYDEIGGVVGVIQKQAGLTVEAFDLDSPEFKRDFNFVFRKLITVGEDGLATKRPAVFHRKDWPAGALDLVDALLDERRRLLITDIKNNEPVLEIAHEALIRHWDLLREWTLEVKSALLTMAKVEQEAKDWWEGRKQLKQEKERLQYDRIMLWTHERLQSVEEAKALLGLEPNELSEEVGAFIRPEHERLLEELEKDFIDHQRRFEIGDRLAVIGDRRPGLGVRDGLPDIGWCKVPAGEVRISGVSEKFSVKDCYISKFPVTLAQFDLFAASKVFYDKKWWEGLPMSPWDQRPYPQTPDNMTNRPAEWVTWYQAVAYCRWLSEALGYKVRLPYEWEWQQAACNGQPEKIYPWGNEWDPARASSSEALGQLVAVGLYPAGQSTSGVMDMSGNVYEWCYNAYDDLHETRLDPEVRRTTRGGSWASFGTTAVESLKVTFRLADFPTGINERGNRIRAGFRLLTEERMDQSAY